MANTQSIPLRKGMQAPDFELLEVVSGKQIGLAQLRGERGTLVMFICNHCPFVKHIEQGLRDLAGDYRDKGIGIAAINANDAEAYPDDSPQFMAEKLYPFAYLYDATQAVARTYQAVCTPEFFVFDAHLKLYYHGQFDDSRPGSDIEVSGADLRSALDCLLADQEAPVPQKPSMGCNIKWRS
jgi:peroxiredoxin